MLTPARSALYATRTSLPKSIIEKYRKTPVTVWTTAADRQVGGAIRGLERMAHDRELPPAEWRLAADHILDQIRAFVDGVVTTVTAFIAGVANAIKMLIDRLRELLGQFAPVVARVKAVFAAVGSRAINP